VIFKNASFIGAFAQYSIGVSARKGWLTSFSRRLRGLFRPLRRRENFEPDSGCILIVGIVFNCYGSKITVNKRAELI